MCNLYDVSAKDDVIDYMRQMTLDLVFPDTEAWAGIVGPFNDGVFVRPRGDELIAQIGQWALIRPGQPERKDWIYPDANKVLPPGKKPRARIARSTNNARLEDIEKKPQFRDAWNGGRRCLIPMAWYQEPNWETGKNIWWHLKRADGLPWMIAGLWSEWVDHASGEVVPNFTALTVNCNDHPLLGRLHKPEVDKATKQPLPHDQQDKRAIVHIGPENWSAWLHGSVTVARRLLVPAPVEMFDPRVSSETDSRLAEIRSEQAHGAAAGNADLF
jgi:putative SOS response-associated peptidase YedK